MTWFPQLYITLNVIGAVISTVLGITLPKNRDRTDLSFQLFTFTEAIWCLLSALFFFNYSIDDFWIWNGLLVIPYVTIPVLWLNFVVCFTRTRIFPIPYFFIVPALTFLIYWIKPLSSLMWKIQNFRVQWGFPIVDFERGFWFRFVHMPYSYAVILIGMGILIREYFKASKDFKDLYLIILVVGIVPMFTNGVTLTSLGQDMRFYDLTPLGYTISNLFFCLAISRHHPLRRSPLAYQTIFSSLQNSILVFDTYDQLVEANPAAMHLLDLSTKTNHASFEQVLPFLSASEKNQLQHQGKTEILHAEQYLEVLQHPIRDRQRNLGSLVTLKDVTQERQLKQQILEGALLYDALTTLPNRTLFQDRLQQAAKLFKRHPGLTFAVLFLDLDRFKVINDSLGHGAGDQILIEVAKRLVSCIREHDTVARLGGDEFAILAENITELEITILCQRLLTVIQRPIVIESRTLQTSASIGIAFSTPNISPEQILRNADLAMYQTKNSGKSGFTTYDHTLHNQLIRTMQLEVDLKNAILKQELFIEFQPIIRLSTDTIMGFEALVRWAHPQEGRVLPIKFIDVAEEIGLIGELDHWVLAQSCQQLALWNQQFPGHDLTISINLSVANFSEPNLGESIAETLTKYQIAGQQLKLEITESLLMDNPESIAMVLEKLKDLGLGIQLDDFGTGHSSLSYLHQLPLDALKIDQSFVMKADQSPQNAAIIKSIVDLAHNLKLIVIGEGVEMESQRALLKELGCSCGQGYFWSPPQSAEQATALINKQWNATP